MKYLTLLLLASCASEHPTSEVSLEECVGRETEPACESGDAVCGPFTVLWTECEAELRREGDYVITVRAEQDECVLEFRPAGRGEIPVGSVCP